MRTYYPKYLDKEIYKRVLSVAKDYYEMIKARKLIEYDKMNSTPNHESGVHSEGISNPVQSIVEQIEKHTRVLDERIRAIDRIIALFPSHEQKFIIQNVMYGVPICHCDTRNCERTCQVIRHDFIVQLAIELGETIDSFQSGADMG